MPDDKGVDPTRYSRSTGEREELLELARKLELEQKRGSGASGDSGASGSMSSAVIEEAAPAIVTSPNNLTLLSSSAEAAKRRRAAFADSAEAKEMAEAAERKSEEREEVPSTMGISDQPGATVEEGNEKDDDGTDKKDSYIAMVLGSGEHARRARRTREAVDEAKEADEE